ncbi:LLM class flavin-dependent oxidoreductase [Micromonospora parathelypteridis]|uniref:Alkanesulfonate monooxygenase SsuD/methylene tetrahydromethanopterin reductase-like flavin-dependent oxidoreductase (Luciferase family) n=1 Tax=Micromonospora parathelypteridis TaxID=1839617 RepID=A0A840VPK5_9ACTN|nr:LLM class flavin-dependent oxidoreductase [Micromonospora parathelypteridis]MBB5475974.1 alkanesulfonate monooxygenase SsuD/methylene tetrahydromethanopterin reductase-like flavin-dependent oxidoreductase (luciferase family) [Micromonospora parathelypteridis]GGO32238.1 FMNH2-utilizing oxygenase [Micromonospora parathelypteridis]
MTEKTLHLAVALDGLGWHPAAWRLSHADATAPLTARYWNALAGEAEHGALDLLTIEDSLDLQSSRPDGPDDRVDEVRGRLDAVQIAARIAPLTRHIGLVPTTSTTHTEPFHVSTAVATLDHVSGGRAGWRPRVSARRAEAGHFGRREIPALDLARLDEPEAVQTVGDLFAEAGDAVEVVRRLWDSWQDDAAIRDVPTGRFVDRERLHYIDFDGRWFSVKGPSIVPRSPQGQPVVAALAHSSLPYAFAARHADVVFVTPTDVGHAAAIVAEVRAAEETNGRAGPPLRVLADLVVLLDETPTLARDRRTRLDALHGDEFTSDAAIFAGTPGQLADLLAEWHRAGVDGFRLRPAVLPDDLTATTRALVPALRDRGLFRAGYPGGMLRDLLGLPRPASRYAVAATA